MQAKHSRAALWVRMGSWGIGREQLQQGDVSDLVANRWQTAACERKLADAPTWTQRLPPSGEAQQLGRLPEAWSFDELHREDGSKWGYSTSWHARVQ